LLLLVPPIPTHPTPSPFSLPRSRRPAARHSASRLYVKSLYRRYLNNALNWYIRRDLWRQKAIEIRAEFERNRCVERGDGVMRAGGEEYGKAEQGRR